MATCDPRLGFVIKVTTLRIGVLGGTFDPFHLGHLAMALEVRYRLELNRMLLVVANDPWQKTRYGAVTPAAHRLAMVEAAAAAVNQQMSDTVLEVSAHEISRGGQSFTADTLAWLAEQSSNAELFLIVGSDIAASLDTWKRPDEVRSLAKTIVADRGIQASGRPPKDWAHEVLKVPALEVSSTDLRDRFRTGAPVEALTLPCVVDYVRSHRLYGSKGHGSSE